MLSSRSREAVAGDQESSLRDGSRRVGFKRAVALAIPSLPPHCRAAPPFLSRDKPRLASARSGNTWLTGLGVGQLLTGKARVLGVRDQWERHLAPRIAEPPAHNLR